MNRTNYRNLIIGIALFFLAVSAVVFYQGQSVEEESADLTTRLAKVKQELENAARLSAALTELDQLTIDERTATQLDILRHLGLERADLNFHLEGREIRTVGDTNLYVRTVRIEASMPYPAALYLVDRLHSTKKIVFTDIVVTPANQDDKVNIKLKGKIYGLEKRQPTVSGG